MLLLNNKKAKERLCVTVEKGTKVKSIVIDRELVLKFDTTEITKIYKVEVSKDLNLNRDEYFKFINHLAGSINDYKKFLKEHYDFS